MIEKDTVRLLRECDAGVNMGVKSIDDVLKYVTSDKLYTLLSDSKDEHERIRSDINEMLRSYDDEGKHPNPIASGMSYIKTNFKLAVKESDKTIADLMTDGCNMGVKSLSKYLNEYEAADERSKDVAKKLIAAEEQLAVNIREFL